MGAAIYLDPPASTDELIKSADRLMLQAKSEGKNRMQYKVFELPAGRAETTLAANGDIFSWLHNPSKYTRYTHP
jgi:hypothetical protein